MLFQIIGLVVLALDVVAIIHLVRGPRLPLHKVLWALAIIMLPLIGLIAYWILEMKMTPPTPAALRGAVGAEQA